MVYYLSVESEGAWWGAKGFTQNPQPVVGILELIKMLTALKEKCPDDPYAVITTNHC